MENLSTLRKRLKALQMIWAEVEPQTDQEQKARQAIHDKLVFQIECEEIRAGLRVSFQMMATRKITEKTEAGEVEKIRTVFKWEPFFNRIFSELDQREINSINHFNNQFADGK